MRRWFSIAAFSLILLALPVWAQRGGGGGGGGGAHFSGGSSAHVASGSGHSFGVRSSSAMHSSNAIRGGSIGRGSGVRIRTGTTYRTRRVFYRRGYPYAAYYPWGYYPWGYYPWYDGFWHDNSGDQDSYAASAAPAYPAPYAEDSGLGRDVQALSGKIDRLQADVEARNRPKEQEPATALVFRDRHVEEVHNYAIAGGTLWVINEQAAKKIPLAQLDIPATVKMNDDRGVDFQVPQPSLSIQIVN